MAEPIPPVAAPRRPIEDGPEPTPPLVATAITPSPKRDSWLVMADPQLAFLKTWSLIRSSTINAYSPAVRLAGSMLAIPSFMYHLAKVFHEKYGASARGTWMLGDLGDTAAKSELAYFATAFNHIRGQFPELALTLIAPGNHDAFPNGTFNTGGAFLGILSVLLGVETLESSLIDNIATLEVGQKSELLDKEGFLKFVYQQFGWPWQPTTVIAATKKNYDAKGGMGHKWSNTRQVMRDFWQKDKQKNTWHTLVQYKDYDDDLKAEQQWLHLTASHMGTYKTTKGNIPVYEITVDSIDFLEDSSTGGAMQGHISFIQTRLIQAFMQFAKKMNPRAKFIINTHFALDDIDIPWASTISTLVTPSRWMVPLSEFNQVLSDTSVIAVIAAHSHRWDYKDLNSPEIARTLGISRKTPLPQIKVTSMVDQPIGAAALSLSADGEDLVLDFEKIEIDAKGILRQCNPVIKEELERVNPYLNTYVSAWHNMMDPHFKYFSHPEIPLSEKIPVLLDYDVGKLYEEGRISDQLQAEDVIFLMVEQAKLKLRLYMASLRLTLNDAGLGHEADAINDIFYKHFDQLEAYYQIMLILYNGKSFKDVEKETNGDVLQQVKQSIASSPQQSSILIDKFTEMLGRIFIQAVDAVRAKRGTLDPASAEFLRLDKAGDMISDLYSLTNVYKEWLKRYEGALAAKRPAREVKVMTDLLVTAEWERMDQRIRSLPFDDSATTFITLLGLTSTKRRSQFFRSVPSKNVPQHIQIRISADDGQVKMTDIPDAFTAAEREQLLKDLPRPKRWGEELADQARNQLPVHPSVIGHWVGRAAFNLNEEVDSFGLSVGGQMHWLPKQYGWLRWTNYGLVDLHTNGPRGTELQLSVSPQIDLLGNISVGPVATVGMAFRNRGNFGPDENAKNDAMLTYGVGGELNLFDGATFIKAMNTWYHDDTTAWSVTLGIDVFSQLRFWNLWPRHR